MLVRLRKLNRDPNGYRKHGEVLIEGEHLCQAFAAAGTPRHALVSSEAWDEPVLRELASRAAAVAVVPAALLAEVSALESAPPLAFVIDWPGRGSLQPGRASIVLDRVQDPGNVGSILRSAAAFGFHQVVALAGSAALWSPKVVRAAMGAHVGLALVEVAAGESLAALDALEVPAIATSSHADAAIDTAELPSPCAWIVGHEGQGVAPELLARSRAVRIPQPGGQESLNVAVAAALCMYESTRRRSAS
nr:RNA methyltransferase [Schlegelella koreensis]